MSRQIGGLRLCLLSSVAGTLVLGSHPAVAQTSSEGTSGTAQSASPPGAQTARVAPNLAAGDIIVTARRRAESLSKVPVAVTAFSAETLREKGINDVNDLQYSTPNLTAQSALEGRQSTRFFIRGQGASFGGSLPSVVTYLADVPLDPAGGGAFALLDLQSVQVLRGPQGTLFGRNANGGAVVLTPKAPGHDVEGFLEASYGNYNDVRVTGAVTLPITDTLSVRLAGQFNRHDGYTINLSGPDLDNDRQGAWRAFVRWEPTSEIRDDFIYAGIDGRDNGTAAILTNVRPGSSAASYPLALPLPNQIGPGLTTDLANQRQYGPRKIDYSAGLLGNTRRIDFFANTFSYNFGNAVLKNISSYQRVKVCSSNAPVTSATNFYLSTCFPNQYSLPITSEIYPTTNLRVFTNETNISGTMLSDKLTYILGAFVLDSDTLGGLDTFRVSKANKTSVAVNLSSSQTHDKAQAIYAQSTYALIDTVKATVGLRYTWDQRATSFGQFQSVANGAPGSYRCGAPGQLPTAGIDTCYNIYERKSSGFNYTLGLDWQANPDLLVYAVTRQGYKAGGINNLSTSATPEYAPEKLNDVELGAKYNWTAGAVTGRLSAAYFHGWYKGIQTQLVQIIAGGGAAVVIGNAGKANLDGAELEASARLGNLNLSAFYSYLDARYVKGTFFDVGQDVSASAFNGVSKNTFSATAGYSIPLNGPTEQITLSGTYYTRSRAAYASNNVLDPEAFAPGYQIVNGRVEWSNVGGTTVSLAAYGENLFGKNYVVGGFGLIGLVGSDARVYGAPRTYGLSASYRF